MKLFLVPVALLVVVLMTACGGKSQNGTEDADKTSQKTDSVAATSDSLKLKAGKYANETLGYSITYPSDILELDKTTENADEQVFLPKNTSDKAKLRIYKDDRKDKSGKVLNFNEIFDQDKVSTSKREVSYSSLNPLFYTIAGVEGKEIFYQKTIVSKGSMVTAKLTYTKEGKSTYDAMIAPLFNSFK